MDERMISSAANLKSGDNTAADVIAICRSVLNPIQIFELSSSGPDEALNLITKLGKNRCRVCVCGGDGSVGWILTEIFKRQIEPLPEVCILPIGTGNDLARVLGWGAVPPTVLHPSELCEKVFLPTNYERRMKRSIDSFCLYFFCRFKNLMS